MRMLRRVLPGLALLLLAGGWPSGAQSPAPAPPPVRPVAPPVVIQTQPVVPAQSVDPLVNLMMSQPAIDTDTPPRATASFDPPEALPGARVSYRVVVTALKESSAG